MITAVVMTDGRRDCIVRAVESLDRLKGPISAKVIHDDSGDVDYEAWLWQTFPGWLIKSTGRRSGFGAAVRSARSWLFEHDRNPFTWWHEDDFVLTRDIDLHAMMRVLNERPQLTQLALRRQPWNEQEKAAGGVVEQYPGDFHEWSNGDATWLEHRRWFTTNPALLPRWIIDDTIWPLGANSEGHYGLALFRDPTLYSGFWGSLASGEWCEHIGRERIGTGY
jgi:hypothetical protein